jgi:hypothetical protein
MKELSVKPTEHKCPACNGTGFPVVAQPADPVRKIYPVQDKIYPVQELRRQGTDNGTRELRRPLRCSSCELSV